MARPLKARNATGVGSVALVVDVHFSWEYTYTGQSPEVKQQIVDMAMNASGVRDTARVLRISPTTVLKELKKRNWHSTR
jgi:transposase-like protein